MATKKTAPRRPAKVGADAQPAPADDRRLLELRARRVLASQGRPVAIASNLSADELQAIAELVRVDGTLVAGIREKFTRWYAGYLTARKATEATEA